jgi:trimethylamine--corrinoid protein Co-methyltransferase
MELFRRDRADLVARPMSIFTVTATGNFRYGEDSCQNLLDCVEAGIPVEIVPVTLMGLIAPVTLVGATVFHTADVLAGVTMAQIVKPGAPVLFGGAPATFHMKAASAPMAAIEALHLDVAYVQVGKALGLPTQAYMALSDGKLLDAQAGAETFGSALLAALAGVNSVSGPGMLDYVLVFSLAKLVLDDELCGQALHFVRPIEPRDDLPARELVTHLLDEAHLIMAEHTTRHWPEELWLTGPTFDRDNRETWERKGAKSLEARAAEEVERRLAAYRPPETDHALVDEMLGIVRSGMEAPAELPALPPLPDPVAEDAGGVRRRNRRRERPG